MIFGIGTDIVAIGRLQGMWERHGSRCLGRLLAPEECAGFEAAVDKGRFLAKRFAAKEAFAKALGTGVRPPALLPAIRVEHDLLGRPYFGFSPDLSAYMAERLLTAHLSVSDEADYATAFVVLETT